MKKDAIVLLLFNLFFGFMSATLFEAGAFIVGFMLGWLSFWLGVCCVMEVRFMNILKTLSSYEANDVV